MKLKYLPLIFSLGIVHSIIGQISIPQPYQGKFPYYVGNTRLEAEQYNSSGNHYLIMSVDPSQLDTTGSLDVSGLIQSVIDQAATKTGTDTFVTVLLPAGKLRIEQTIRIPGHVVLKGQGARTSLLIATGENRHGILIAPAGPASLLNLPLLRTARRGSREIYVNRQDLEAYTLAYGMPRYLTLCRLDDAQLLTSSWAKARSASTISLGACATALHSASSGSRIPCRNLSL